MPGACGVCEGAPGGHRGGAAKPEAAGECSEDKGRTWEGAPGEIPETWGGGNNVV